MYPKDLKYTKTHEWIKVEEEKVRIGITDYAQEQLGDIVFVELPEIGKKLEKSREFGAVESIKTVSDLCAPVSGEVIETNKALIKKPELINDDPYNKGWLIIVKIAEPKEISSLMNDSEYEKFIKG